MKKLWVFGCSISDLYDSETSKYYWSAEYLEWKGYVPRHHTQIIADELGCELVNCAVSAANNYQIFQDFCDKAEQISKDDYIIIQWTEPNRFRLVNDEDEWIGFAFHSKWTKFKLKKFKFISFETIQQILTNRLSSKYRDEINSWEKLIKLKYNSNKLLVWKPFDKLINNGKIVNSIETIRNETNNQINDLHFSENGQIVLSKILLNMINGNSKDII